MTNIELIGRRISSSYRYSLSKFFASKDKGKSLDFDLGQLAALNTIIDSYNLIYTGKYKIDVPSEHYLFDANTTSLSIILYKVSSHDGHYQFKPIAEYAVY